MSGETLKGLFFPGSVLLLATALLLRWGLFPYSPSAVTFYFYLVLLSGLLLAGRFHSSAVVFALGTLLLAHWALEFFSRAAPTPAAAGKIAYQAVALLLPANFLLATLARERGIVASTVISRAALLFLESVFVAVICRPGATAGPGFLHAALLDRHLFLWTKIPQPAWLAFVLVCAVLAIRFVIYRRPTDSGMLWSLLAVLAGLNFGLERASTLYFATAGIILSASIIENSYLLAYHDELTALPGRRAFNEACLRLQPPYAIATVDIDHFKKVNDTYGHDTGDQVLRMVAARLARVGAGGRAFRVGGEEFSILFPEKSLKEALPCAESLRSAVERFSFRIRGLPERRSLRRGQDRRSESEKTVARRLVNYARRVPDEPLNTTLAVTISIGIAEPSGRNQEVEQVIRAADKALYRAKHGGRNRVEASGQPRRSRLRRSIA